MESVETRAEHDSELPSLPARLVSVFFRPGELMEQLAEEPKWIGALIAVTLVVTGRGDEPPGQPKRVCPPIEQAKFAVPGAPV